MDVHPWFLSAKRVLATVFPGNHSQLRLADVGCLEGGFSVEFARMGFEVLGLDVRAENIAACHYVQQQTTLPNLSFVEDDAWNLGRYGPFDAVFCSGLLYHLDRPKQFLNVLSDTTKKVLILQTHFAPPPEPYWDWVPAAARHVFGLLVEGKGHLSGVPRFNLSRTTKNEGLQGRWFSEYRGERAHLARRDKLRWASWDNTRSFWLRREHLIGAILQAGFDLVLEQFDFLGHDITEAMLHGLYRNHARGTFIGIKTET